MDSLENVIKNVWIDSSMLPGDFLDTIRNEYRMGNVSIDWFLYEFDFTSYLNQLEWWKPSWIIACLHQLCIEFGFSSIPNWIMDRKWVLDRPYWASNIKNDHLKVILLYESPYPFRARNIYVDKDVMRRV